MKELTFKEKCQVIAGWLLIKSGRFKFEIFTVDELNALLAPHLPLTLNVNVPVGKATLTCMTGNIHLPRAQNQIQLHLLTDFRVELAGNPIYRAHLKAEITAVPDYDVASKTLHFTNIQLPVLSLVDDEYSFVNDSRSILQQVPTLGLATSLVSPLKQVINTVTGGVSNAAMAYLESFTHGNKQKLLAQHRPAIEQALLAEIDQFDLHFVMRDNDWQEYLFARLGKRVSVDDHLLKFWFSSN